MTYLHLNWTWWLRNIFRILYLSFTEYPKSVSKKIRWKEIEKKYEIKWQVMVHWMKDENRLLSSRVPESTDFQACRQHMFEPSCWVSRPFRQLVLHEPVGWNFFLVLTVTDVTLSSAFNMHRLEGAEILERPPHSFILSNDSSSPKKVCHFNQM